MQYYQFSPEAIRLLPSSRTACGFWSFLTAASEYYSEYFKSEQDSYWIQLSIDGGGVDTETGEAYWNNLIRSLGLENHICYDDKYHSPSEIPDYYKVAFTLSMYRNPATNETHFIVSRITEMYGQAFHWPIHDCAGRYSQIVKEGYVLESSRWFWRK